MSRNYWSQWFQEQCGEPWPSDYTTFDTETTGFSFNKDFIVEWGHCVVRDRVAVNRYDVILNWYERSDVVPAWWLDEALARVQRRMRLRGLDYHVTPDRMKSEGVHPDKVMEFLYDFLTTLQGERDILVSHNGIRYDCRMIRSHFESILLRRFQFDPTLLLDTGAVEKLCQMNPAEDLLRLPAETLEGYCRRVTNYNVPGVKWGLDLCVEKYGLADDPVVVAESAHSAGRDAYVLHLLMEHYRVYLESLQPVTASVRTSVKPQSTSSTRETMAVRRRGQRNR